MDFILLTEEVNLQDFSLGLDICPQLQIWGAPKGVGAVWSEAFRQGYPRTWTWNGTHVNESLRETFRWAARYYKRGVLYREDAHLWQPPVSFPKAQWIELNHSAYKTQKNWTIVDDQVEIPGDVVWGKDLPKKKDIHTLCELGTLWKKAGCPTSWTVIGGGSLTDLAGFAGALAKVKLQYKPSTLLNMVDAAHGGKTSVDVLGWGKNLLGAFYGPQEILWDQSLCQTWSEALWQEGRSEAVKHVLLQGSIPWLENILDLCNKKDIKNFWPHIKMLAKIKLNIVEKDPFETKGVRESLNLGHGLAHGLEGASCFAISHGDGVAAGLWHSFCLLEKLFPQSLDFAKKMKSLWKKWNLLPNISYPPWADLYPYLFQDKLQNCLQPKTWRTPILLAMGKVVLAEVPWFQAQWAYEQLQKETQKGNDQ